MIGIFLILLPIKMIKHSISFLFILFFAFISLQSQTKDTVYVVEDDKVYTILKNPQPKNVKAELGFVIGTPGVTNLVIAAHTNDFLFKLTAGYFDAGSYGAQFDIGYKVFKEDETYQAIGLGTGYSVITNQEEDYYNYTSQKRYNWKYLVLDYILNTRGFYLNLGLSAGVGSFPNPQLMFQIGYVYQFR